MSQPWKSDDYFVSSWSYQDVASPARAFRSGAVRAGAA